MSFISHPVPLASPHEPLADLVEINQKLKAACVGLQFEFDDLSEQIVARMLNAETGKQIRRMASEELMQLSKVLGKLHDLLVYQAICRKAQLTEQIPLPAPTRWSSSWTAMGVPG